jgi:hypothetical protein
LFEFGHPSIFTGKKECFIGIKLGFVVWVFVQKKLLEVKTLCLDDVHQIGNVVIQIIIDFGSGWGFIEKDGPRTTEEFEIGGVFWKEGNNPLGQIEFAAMIFERGT